MLFQLLACSPAQMLHFEMTSGHFKIAPRGFEPLSKNQQSVENKTLTQNQNPVLDASLDKILQKHPEIASVILAWPDLPESVKAEIKKLVEIQPLSYGSNGQIK